MFFATMLGVETGYSYAGGLLLLASFWFLAKRPALDLESIDKAMLYALLAYFLVSLASLLYLGNSVKDLDQSVRTLAAIPLLLLLLHVPVSLAPIWAGIVVGAVSSMIIAAWQLHVLHYDRAEGFLNIIHFGNIALVFGAFCVGGLFWAGAERPRARLWRAAFVLGMVCSGYSVIASGSRGSWVAMFPLLIVFAIAYINRRNAWRIGGAVVVLAAVVAMLFAAPDSRLRQRYDAAVSDITRFEHKDEADTSIGARFAMWEGALANIAKKPLLGWNLQDYTNELRRRVDANELDPVVLQFNDNLHNNYLQAWVFEGLPGLLALLALYLVPLWHFGRRLRDADLTVRTLAFCGTSLVASYLCFGLTQVILRRVNGIMFFVLTLVILWGCLRHAIRASASTRR